MTTKPAAHEGDKLKKSKKRKHSVVLHQNGPSKERTSIYDVPSSDSEEKEKDGPVRKRRRRRSEIKRSPSIELDSPPKEKKKSTPKKRKSETRQAVVEDDEEDTKKSENPPVSKPLQSSSLETSKPSALFKPRTGRNWTLSMAVAGSIIANVMKPDHKTLLAGRIARAAAVFCVDEIIVFDDDPTNIPNYIDPVYTGKGKKTKAQVLDSIAEQDEPWQNPDQFLYHVLSYAECPPHLRADQNPSLSLFPQHQNLKWAGMLPSLDMPHHLKSYEWCRFREGVTLGPASDVRSTPKSNKAKGKSDQQPWTYVKCGLPYPVRVAAEVPPVMRVTLKFKDPQPPKSWPHLSQQECEELEVEAVAPTAPRQEEGYYWGYQVRRASSLSEVFTASEFQDGYDLSIGTSERGAPLKAILPDHLVSTQIQRTRDANVTQLPSEFNHLLVVFGGVAGLEPAIAGDPEFQKVGLTKETAHEAFDSWVNLVQGQGSRTIRTEEAVEFGLFGLKDYVDSMYDRNM